MLEHVTTIWLALDRYAEAVQNSYRETVAERARAQGRERERLLAILFGEHVQNPALLLDSADALDLPRRATFCVVASDGAEEAAGSDGRYDPPSVQLRLREQGIDSVWRRSSQECLGIIPLGPDRLATGSMADCLQSALLGRIGISPAFGEIVHTGRAVLKARLARACLPADESGPSHYGDRPLGLLIANAPETADEIATRILAPVLAQPPEDCALLLDTARAWYGARGSIRDAAQTLYCHPNTVRYRLKRLESLTGLALDDPHATTNLLVALEAFSLRPPTSGDA
ncbi:PucR family transcriptional regulator [Streptomyces sp. NPDC002795]|uniref:PucR family transcriptional regulator n=1 Tax=Streptomyces sp. NPDC002795 TaxID=3364665 RepID=UPI0036B6FEF2